MTHRASDAAGCRFAGESDTEMLLHLYDRGGRAMVEQLPVDRFAARQALDARLAAARLERVLGIRRRLSDAVKTAMDAVLIATSARAPAEQMDRC